MEAEDGRQKSARIFGEMSLSGVEPLSARQAAKQLTDRMSSLIKPWLTQRVGGEDDLDLIARWYMINAPQMLREAGVDVGRLDKLVGRTGD